MKTLYISGPMAGIPEHNFPAFFSAEDRLREQGFLVNNPAALQPGPPEGLDADATWAWCLKRDIPHLLTADEVVCLPGWQLSRGAMLEVMIAQRLFMKAWDYRDGRLHEPGTVPPLDAYGDLAAHNHGGAS